MSETGAVKPDQPPSGPDTSASAASDASSAGPQAAYAEGLTRARVLREPPPRARGLVLLDPRGAFSALCARPLPALMLGVMLALALAPPLSFVSRVDAAVVLERELKRSGRLEQIPPEQLEQVRSVGAMAMTVALPVTAVGKRAGWIFLVTALAFLLMRGARPGLRFSTTLAAVALGCAPLALHDLIAALLFLTRDPLLVADAQNAVLSNPAAWLGQASTSSVSAALLRGLDFFDLWCCALIALGINVVAGARSVIPWVVSYGSHLALVGFSSIMPALRGAAGG